MVFKRLGFPGGFITFIETLLFHNVAFMGGKGDRFFLSFILAGIIQGCPSSGLVFACASHPFLYAIERKQQAINKATPNAISVLCCCDDVGAALASHKLLCVLSPVFQ